jgi:hypothetical protein
MAELRCDFCSVPSIAKDYACESFTAFDAEGAGKRLVATSNGKWAACQACADLIDHDRWEKLAQRSYDTSGIVESGVRKEILLEYIRGLHRQFRELRLKAN